jgi:hypothetical protein
MQGAALALLDLLRGGCAAAQARDKHAGPGLAHRWQRGRAGPGHAGASPARPDPLRGVDAAAQARDTHAGSENSAVTVVGITGETELQQTVHANERFQLAARLHKGRISRSLQGGPPNGQFGGITPGLGREATCELPFFSRLCPCRAAGAVLGTSGVPNSAQSKES